MFSKNTDRIIYGSDCGNMNNVPLISIITPCYNRAILIKETATSVFTQTYKNWEWIIVDDGSTDGSINVINNYASVDSRVKVFNRLKMPKGACVCRNIGVLNSTGKYLLFLDTDDILESFCLEQRVNAILSDSELDFAIFPSLMFQNKPFDLNLSWNIDKPISELSRQFYQDAICQGTGILISRDAFLRVGMWDEDLSLWQDIDLFFKLYIQNYKYKKFFNLPADLHNRINTSSLSRSDFFRLDKLVSRVKVIKCAAKLLISCDQRESVPELKYMLAEVISGYHRVKQWNEASKLMDWGLEIGVFNQHERRLLVRLQIISQFKLYHFIGMRKYMTKITKLFKVPIQITLGTMATNN
jgi:glycosyltransferase involved in cell wall biosynthesis